MSVRLATPSFTNTSKDDVVVVDVYKKNNAQTVNSIQEISNPFDQVNFDNVAGVAKKNVNVLPRTYRLLNTKNVSKDKFSLLGRVTNLNPNVTKAVRALDEATRSKLLKTMSAAGVPDRVTAGAGGIMKQFSLTNPGSVRRLAEFVTNLKDGNVEEIFNYRDPRAHADLLGAAMAETLKYDLPDSTKDILESINDREVIDFLAGGMASTFADHGRANDLFNLAYSSTPGTILMNVPDVINRFARSYNPSFPEYAQNYTLEYQKVMAAFALINPWWDLYIRKTTAGNENCVNVIPLMGASQAFNKMLGLAAVQLQDPKAYAYLAASVLNRTTVEVELKKQFPLLVMNLNRNIQRVSDPRLLNV